MKMNELNPSSHFDRSSALKLCKEFYNPLFSLDADTNMDFLENLNFEDIGNWELERTPCDGGYDLSAIINILKYMYCSYKSYSSLTSAVQSKPSSSLIQNLPDYITFPTYVNDLYQIVLNDLYEQYSQLNISDLYSDSIIMSFSTSYPLQHMNIFFRNDAFLRIKKAKPSSNSSLDSINPLNDLSAILKKYNLIDFKTNVLKKPNLDLQADYFIPKYSVFSLTFVLLSFKNHNIPKEFQYMILSDFIINVCIADGQRPYEIICYLIKAKNAFPLKDYIKFYGKFIKSLHNKTLCDISSISSKRTAHSLKAKDEFTLFMEFSSEYVKLLESYYKLRHYIENFRKIEKCILKKTTDELTDILNSNDTPAEPEIYSIKWFLEEFEYDINRKNYIPSERLYEYFSNDFYDNFIIKSQMFNVLFSICSDKKNNEKPDEESEKKSFDGPFDKINSFHFDHTFFTP